MTPHRLPDRTIDPDIPESEHIVFRALEKGLGADYRVIHSLSWQLKNEYGAPSIGEADFCVIHSTRGMLVFEVKGGDRIRRDGDTGIWYSQDSAGSWHTIKDPAKQGLRAVHSLKGYMYEHLGPETLRSMVGFGVIFPGLPRLGKRRSWGPDLPDEIVVYENELQGISTRIEAIFQIWSTGEPNRLDPEFVRKIENLLSPTLTVSIPLRHELERIQSRLITLTDQQVRQFRSMRRNRVLDVYGSAGSGKTILAMERARQCAKDGLRTFLTCHNRLLAEELKRMTAGTPNLTVEAFHPFCEAIANFAGRQITAGDREDERRYYNEFLPDLLVDLIANHEELRFDAVVVDEAQNLEGNAAAALRLAMKNSDQSFFYRFLDDGQRIFGTPAQAGGPSSGPSFELLDNVRNTQKIHDLARRFRPEAVAECLGPEGRDIEYIKAPDRRKVREMVRKTLHRLHKEEKIPLEDIAIIAGCTLSKSSFCDTAQVGPYTLRRDTIDPPTHPPHQTVDVFSVWRFQGLERKVVILVDLETPIEYNHTHVLYVATTRAQAHLIIIGSDEVLAHMGLENKLFDQTDELISRDS